MTFLAPIESEDLRYDLNSHQAFEIELLLMNIELLAAGLAACTVLLVFANRCERECVVFAQFYAA